MTEGVSAEVDPANLRAVLAMTREFDPKLATGLRRELRGVGEQIIAEQKAILDGPLPTGVEKVGQRLVAGYSRKNKIATVTRRNIYADRKTNNTKSTGMREAIKAGLKTKVVAGKTRQGIAVTTTKKGEGRKYPMSRAWNTPLFRKRLFGRNEWSYQKGQPYFFGPAAAGGERAREVAIASINRALEQITT
ncbi:hypothetical protein QN354_02160 [Cryobacterium sp. 5I3]|uniref:hypothetical protein n=1 Tax=Cryobacterium sp. 5I3 TaxID=3048592 RepID=UPI002B22BC04|nr:hypothetical protein [Cryobacterium sp. 5I3]MEB0200558.1 hypothetical protein [Cryobacterium sp. 5I3]